MTATSEIQANLYKVTNPLVGKVVSNRRLTAESRGTKNDVRHITIGYTEKYPYIPGQSAGIIPPGIDERTGKPNKLRLYSISSDRHGDDGNNNTVSVCVVRHYWTDPATGEDRMGVCSQYICDLKAGDEVQLTGPVGKHFVIPEDFKKRDFIFVATGTGIAPYRGMLRELFASDYEGQAWLFLGVPYGDCLLYDDEFQAFQKKHSNFHYVTALSREEKNPCPQQIPTRNDRNYVQCRLYENREALKTAFTKTNGVMYLCGLKGMEEGIFPILEEIGKSIGQEGSYAAHLKAQHQLLVEVY